MGVEGRWLEEQLEAEQWSGAAEGPYWRESRREANGSGERWSPEHTGETQLSISQFIGSYTGSGLT